MSEWDRDRDLLELIVELIGHVQRRVLKLTAADFLADKDEIDLTAFRLLHIGEATNKLSPEIKAGYPAMPWADIYRMRNIISHDYFGVDPHIVWQTAMHGMEELLMICRAELNSLN